MEIVHDHAIRERQVPLRFGRWPHFDFDVVTKAIPAGHAPVQFYGVF